MYIPPTSYEFSDDRCLAPATATFTCGGKYDGGAFTGCDATAVARD